MDSPVAPFPCLAGRATFRSPSSFVFREFCSSLAAEAFIEVTCLLGDFHFISSVSPACCSERLNSALKVEFMKLHDACFGSKQHLDASSCFQLELGFES